MSEVSVEAPLSAATREAIRTEVAKFPQPRGALLGVLRLVQRERGALSLETLRELAPLLGASPGELFEVVSFYNLFRTASCGRHVVGVCTNLPCSLRGARELLARLEEHLTIRAGQSTSDGRIHLVREECLGACAGAPMLRIGEVYHEGLDAVRARALMDALE